MRRCVDALIGDLGRMEWYSKRYSDAEDRPSVRPSVRRQAGGCEVVELRGCSTANKKVRGEDGVWWCLQVGQ